MKEDPYDIETIQELADYLEGCVALEGKKPWPDIASYIVGTICSPQHDDWYDTNLTYQELFDIASNMEAWPVYGLRKTDWLRLKKLVRQFAKRVKNGDLSDV